MILRTILWAGPRSYKLYYGIIVFKVIFLGDEFIGEIVLGDIVYRQIF